MSKTEYSSQRWVPIPEEVWELYIQVGRPRPLYRARRLEKYLGLKKTRIYYKREDLSPTGSQDQHGRPSSVFRSKGEKEYAGYRNWRGSVGDRAVLCCPINGPKVYCFSGSNRVYDWKVDRGTEIVGRLVSFLRRLGYVKAWVKKEGGCTRVLVCSKKLYELLLSKDNPYEPKDELAFLAGLIDGDGSITKSMRSYGYVEVRMIFSQISFLH